MSGEATPMSESSRRSMESSRTDKTGAGAGASAGAAGSAGGTGAGPANEEEEVNLEVRLVLLVSYDGDMEGHWIGLVSDHD